MRLKKKSKKEKKVLSLAQPEFISRICPQFGLSFSDDKFIKMGDGYMTCVYVYQYPKAVFDSWLNDLTTVLSGTAVMIDIMPQDSVEVRKNIGKSMEEQSSRYNTANNNIDLIDAGNRLAELEEMYHEIDRLGKIMELICVRIYVPGRTMAECDEKAKEVMVSLDKYKTGICLYESKQDYVSMLKPLSQQQKTIYKKELQAVPSRVLAAGNPFHFSKLSDPYGFYWGETDTGGSVLLDIFAKTNVRLSYNMLLVGMMGFGKSTILKKAMEDRAKRGDFVRVFDVAGEFRELTLLYGGKVVSLDGSSDNKLNALQILRTGDTDSISYSKHMSKMGTIYKYLEPDASETELLVFTRLLAKLYIEMGIVKEIIEDGVVKEHRIAIDIATYPTDQYPLWSDFFDLVNREKLQMELEGKIGTEEYRHVSNVWEICQNVCTVYGSIFNCHTTMNNIFKEPILCFDIKNLSTMNSNIFDAQIFNVLTLCWANIVEVGGEMKDRWETGRIEWEDITRSFILIDEAHRWINARKTTAISQIAQMEREGRKYFAGIGLASQQLRDFVPDHSSHEGIDEIKNLFELSTYKFIMHQDSNSKEKFRQVLGNTCTEWELDQIPQLEQGETILSISGYGNIKFKVYVSDEELAVYRGGA